MRLVLRYLCCAVVSIFFLFTSSSFADQTPIKKIIVFGDSLSDDGNLYHLSYSYHDILDKIPPIIKNYPTGYVPSRYNTPYYGGRFSNGKTWVEDVANLFDILDTNVHRDGLFVDYAYGGANAENFQSNSRLPTPNIFPPNLTMQVAEYDWLHPLNTPDNTVLSIIMAGANDYLGGSQNIDKTTTYSVSSISHAIINLYSHGVRHFLIAGLPDLGLTYDAYRKGQAFAAEESSLATMHNQKLMMAIQDIQHNQKAYPDIHITFFNWMPFHKAVLSQYQQAGFSYANTQPCHPGANIPISNFSNEMNNPELQVAADVLTSAQNTLPNACDKDADNPSQHIYMDPVHPTRVVHCMIALTACHFLQGQYAYVKDSKQIALQCHMPESDDPVVLALAAAKQCWQYEKQGWLMADSPIEA